MRDQYDAQECQGRFDRRTALKFTGGLLLTATTGEKGAAAGTSLCSPKPYEEYAKHDALGLAELVRKKDVEPEELLEAAIARAEAVDPKIHAIVLKLYDAARREIANGLPQGPFTGVPFLVKDLGFWMKDVPCSEGSRLFRGAIPDEDETVVKRFRKAGLVIFGRTRSPEFGLLPTTESTLFPITRNPWNLERTAGGSSGGTAAAVAAGIVPMGSGSDGGGSIRIPASCCGLFGLKPTRSRVPVGPRMQEVFGGMCCYHALTRSVRDSAALLDATSGAACGDVYAAPANADGSFLSQVGKKPKPLRIASVLSTPNLKALDPECRRAVEIAEELCRDLGHNVEPATESFAKAVPWADLMKAMVVIFVAGTTVVIEDRLSQLGRDLGEDDVEPYTRTGWERGKEFTAVDLTRARRSLHESSLRVSEFQRAYDVILTPTLGKPPIPHGIITPRTSDPDVVLDEYLAFTPFTFLANCTGQPAMTVPLHWTRDGLPVGVHFMGRFGDEATLLRLASQLERERPWKDKRPPI